MAMPGAHGLVQLYRLQLLMVMKRLPCNAKLRLTDVYIPIRACITCSCAHSYPLVCGNCQRIDAGQRCLLCSRCHRERSFFAAMAHKLVK